MTETAEVVEPPNPGVESPPDRVLSIAAFAKWMIISEHRVRAAILRGDIVRGILRQANGRILVVDKELARQDWQIMMDRKSLPGSALLGTLTEARRALYTVQTQKIAQQLRVSGGDLVSRKEMEKYYGDRIVTVRNKMLGLTSRLRQRFQDLEGEVLRELDFLVREALEELAGPRQRPEEEN